MAAVLQRHSAGGRTLRGQETRSDQSKGDSLLCCCDYEQNELDCVCNMLEGVGFLCALIRVRSPNPSLRETALARLGSKSEPTNHVPVGFLSVEGIQALSRYYSMLSVYLRLIYTRTLGQRLFKKNHRC
jgi:hypothetical protein